DFFLHHHHHDHEHTAIPPVDTATSPIIQVEPFNNLIQDQQIAYLAEGLQAQLISDLSHYPILRVRFGGVVAKGPLPEGQRPADFSLRGTVIDLGGTVRLTLLLVDERDSNILWSTVREVDTQSGETHREMLESVQSIVANLGATSGILQAQALREVDLHRQRAPEPTQISSFECILRWRAYDSYKNNADREAVHTCLRELTENGTQDGSIWAAHAFLTFLDWTKQTDLTDIEALDNALIAANRAIQLSPDESTSHEYLASILMARGDLDTALQSYARAATLNPSNPDVRVLLGWNRILRGDWENGVADVRMGLTISPNPPGWFRIPLSMDAFRQGDYRAALSQADLMIISGDERGIPLALAAAIRLEDMVAIERYQQMLAQSELNQEYPFGSIKAVLNMPHVVSKYLAALEAEMPNQF
ncbi:MAG: hypothetical protein AAF213_09735, partial [Pseudomonadota bacterium]